MIDITKRMFDAHMKMDWMFRIRFNSRDAEMS